MAVEAIQDFGTGGSPSATVTGTGQTVTLTSSWAPFALTFSIPSITGKTLGTNSNDYFGLLFWTSAGSDFNARTNSLGLQTIGVDLWGVHIKVGTHTTAATDLYKQPELGPELARCQRYFYRYVGSGDDRFVVYLSAAGSTQAVGGSFPVTMRVEPSAAVAQGGSVQIVRALDDITGTTFTTLSAQPHGNSKFRVLGNVALSNASQLLAFSTLLNFEAEL
jgi:hypothetical protein